MDIKDSSLNRYKPRASSVNTRTSGISSYERSQSIHNTPEEQSQKAIQLKQGQQIKGEIVDLRSNSVTISIESGKQMLTAKLANDLPLAIGQQATFLVTEDGQDQITLKYIPPAQTSLEMQTADKALTAANLPKSDRNRMVVTELIKHNMPVDKQSLTNTLRLILSNPSADPITIILLQKNQIPVTAENIAQFQAHQQGTSSLSAELGILTNQIFDLLQHPQTSEGQQLSLHRELLSMIRGGGATPSTTDLSSVPLQNILSPEGFSQVNTLFTKQIQSQIGSIPQELKPAIQQLATSSLSLASTLQLIDQLYDNNTPTMVNTGIDNISTDASTMETSKIVDVTTSTANATMPSPTVSEQSKLPPILSNLWNKFAGPKEASQLLQQQLTTEEMTQLKELLSPMLSTEGKALLSNESLTTNHFLEILQGELPGKSNALLLPLLQSPEYQKTIKCGLHEKWTLSPEQLSLGTGISDFYLNLGRDVAHLQKLLKSSPSQGDFSSVKEAAKDVQDNLQFVKSLNDMFTYLPLPLSFQKQKGQGELYVFTQKKKISPENKNLSVMLHLTMEHLGEINVFLQMDHNHVTSKFYIEDKEAYSLVKDNIVTLSNQLEQHGYVFHGEVNSTYESLDFTKEFLDNNSEDVNLSRYNFDIRA